MIKFSYKYRGLEYVFTYFCKDIESVDGDVISYAQAYEKPEGEDVEVFYSAIINLENNLEDIYQNFDKNCRYEIRRSEKDGIKSAFLKNINTKEMNAFYKFYNKFAKQKGLLKANKRMLQACNQSGQLLITKAELNNQVLVYHVYLVDGKNARLHHSCSLYRSNKLKVSGQVVGRANRWLHFEDIKYFKEAGFKMYDLGGIGHAEDVKNISTFKQEFGGIPTEYFNSKKLSQKAKKQIALKNNIKNILKLKFLSRKK